MPSRIALIINPTSGKGTGATMGVATAHLLRSAGHQVIDVSAGSYELSRAGAATALADGVDTLVVVGGDGMVHLGVNLCAGTPVRLGVVAAGTGNDFARNLDLPVLDPSAAVRVINAGVTRAVDAGRVTDEGGTARWFGGVLGAGFDAVVAARAARMRWPRGAMRYNLAIARELPVFSAIPYVVDLDGERLRTRAMLVAVANTTSFGGGMKVCPDADVSDGLFDVLIVHELSIAAFLRVFPRVFSGTHVGHPAVDIRRARRVRLQAPGIQAQADGEPVAVLPLDVEVVPAALTVAVPDPEGSR